VLDDEPNETNLIDPTNADSAPAPKRRRASSRAAGAPAAPPVAPPSEEAVKPKRARKVAAKIAVPDPTTAATSVAAEREEVSAPVRARRTRKAAGSAARLSGTASDAVTPVPIDTIAPDVTAPAPKAGRGAIPVPLFQAPEPVAPARRTRTAKAAAVVAVESSADGEEIEPVGAAEDDEEPEGAQATRRRRRRGGRGRRRRPDSELTGSQDDDDEDDAVEDAAPDDEASLTDGTDDGEGTGPGRRRRRRRRRPGEDGDVGDDVVSVSPRVRDPRRDDTPSGVRGSTRLEAKKQRRREGREAGRRRAPILTESEFLARRESVDRVMIVRQDGDRTQIAVLEDGVLVEHYVNRSDSTSMAGNVYLGRVQNVLPSMEAAFVDIGRGRNAVLYAGEVNWDAAGLEGQPRRIELALKSGDPVLVQVTKDPVGHKGARLTSQISLPGRYLVYVPEGSMTGISRKLPDTERNRLKSILRDLVSEDAGVIVRTAAEGASEEELTSDVTRLATQWEDIKTKAITADAPDLLHGEPDVAIRVVRDIFNEDFAKLIVSGTLAWTTIQDYVDGVAPDLAERLVKWVEPTDLFAAYRIDEQLAKALDRKVWLPSGGSLVIDRTEAMTVVDVNTGKFTGQGGNLEETVTRNNLEAAEEIVRQLRLRDVGGIIVIDFIDMVLESNRELVLRRLTECLGRDRTKHQVAEVTSLGLVQMTRKRIGQSLLDVFSEPCEHCNGRGLRILSQPLAITAGGDDVSEGKTRRRRPAPAAPVQVKTGLDPVDAIRAAEHLRAEDAPEAVGTGAAIEESDEGESPAGPKTSRSRRGRGRGRAAASAEPAEMGDAAIEGAELGVADDFEPVVDVPEMAPKILIDEPIVVAPVKRRSRRVTTAGPIATDGGGPVVVVGSA
jgi:ribonuclease E